MPGLSLPRLLNTGPEGQHRGADYEITCLGKLRGCATSPDEFRDRPPDFRRA